MRWWCILVFMAIGAVADEFPPWEHFMRNRYQNNGNRMQTYDYNQNHKTYTLAQREMSVNGSVMADIRLEVERAFNWGKRAMAVSKPYNAKPDVVFDRAVGWLVHSVEAYERFVSHVMAHRYSEMGGHLEVSQGCALYFLSDMCKMSSVAQLMLYTASDPNEWPGGDSQHRLWQRVWDHAEYQTNPALQTLYPVEGWLLGIPVLRECFDTSESIRERYWGLFERTHPLTLIQSLLWTEAVHGYPLTPSNNSSHWISALFRSSLMDVSAWELWWASGERPQSLQEWTASMEAELTDGKGLGTEYLHQYFEMCFMTEAGSQVVHPELLRAWHQQKKGRGDQLGTHFLNWANHEAKVDMQMWTDTRGIPPRTPSPPSS